MHHPLRVSIDYDSSIFLLFYLPWWVLTILAPGYAEGNYGNTAYEYAMERLNIDIC